MTDAHLYIYNVGHGVCTLLTGKKGNGDPYCGVFDCGTRAKNDLCDVDIVIEDMKQKILDNAQGQERIYIDDVVISHQDKDHWSKILDLFFGLNNIEKENGSYKDIVFGRSDDRGWMLTGDTNEPELYTIMDGSYIIERFTKNYTYFARVEYGIVEGEEEEEEIEIKRFIVTISEGLISRCCVYLVDEETSYALLLRPHGENTREEVIMKEDPPLTVKNLVSIIRNYYKDDKIMQDFLSDVEWSFSEEVRECLDNKFENELKEIKIPIKRVTLGGDRVTPGCGILYRLLSAMALRTKSGESNRIPRGGYVILSEDDSIIKMETLPEYTVFLDYRSPLNVIRNATSVVVQFNITNQNMLMLPGDVTAHAFPEILKVTRGKIINGSLKLLLAPHHGSDHSNFLYDPETKSDDTFLKALFNLLLEVQYLKSQCNLVISGYNKVNLHPGGKFTLLAEKYFNDSVIEHSYAYAKTKVRKRGKNWENKIRESLTTKTKSKKRIFTTNCLPLGEKSESARNKYFDYCDGEITIRTISMPAPTRNSVRRPPPDNSFI